MSDNTEAPTTDAEDGQRPSPERPLTDLLDLRQASQDARQFELEEIDLGQLVRGSLVGLAPQRHAVKVIDGGVRATIDPTKVRRIVEHLVGNALRYTSADTPIEVTIEAVPEGALLTVADRGPGIPQDLLTGIFEPFSRGDQIVSHSPGMGIGLSIVARYASAHRGRAWAENRVDGGARFSALFPSAPDASDPPAAA